MNRLIEHHLPRPLNFGAFQKEVKLIVIGLHLYLDTHQQAQTEIDSDKSLVNLCFPLIF